MTQWRFSLVRIGHTFNLPNAINFHVVVENIFHLADLVQDTFKN